MREKTLRMLWGETLPIILRSKLPARRINLQPLTAKPFANAFARVHGAGSRSSSSSPSTKAARDCIDPEKSDLFFGRPGFQAECSYFYFQIEVFKKPQNAVVRETQSGAT
jgi:hypothetical protein